MHLTMLKKPLDKITCKDIKNAFIKAQTLSEV